MSVIGIIIIGAALIYFFFFLLLAVSWSSNPVFHGHSSRKTGVSIIIPFRNEKNTIAACLSSIAQQDYPPELVEIIAVDDHSEDESVALAKNFSRVTLLSCSSHETGKKAALTKGILSSKHELIITRDADTTCTMNWLETIVAAYEKSRTSLIICPVYLEGNTGLLQILQQLEHFAVSGITAATAFMGMPVMSNGANLAFTRSAFEKANGYKNNDHIASGDDIFLMNTIKKQSKKNILFLKNPDAGVSTKPAGTISELFAQRLRWAGKTRFNTDPFNGFIAALVLICNLSFLFLAVLSLFSAELTPYFIFTAILKCFIDFLLLFLAASFQKQRKALFAFPLMVVVYPVYTLLIIILAGTRKTIWKGREI